MQTQTLNFEVQDIPVLPTVQDIRVLRTKTYSPYRSIIIDTHACTHTVSDFSSSTAS